MGMTTRTFSGLFGGVSTQPPSSRQDIYVDEMVNMLPDPFQGVRRRRGTVLEKPIAIPQNSIVLDHTLVAADVDSEFLTVLYKDSSDQYHLVGFNIFGGQFTTEISLAIPVGGVVETYLETGGGALTDLHEPNIKLIAVEDKLIILNTLVTVLENPIGTYTQATLPQVFTLNDATGITWESTFWGNAYTGTGLNPVQTLRNSYIEDIVFWQNRAFFITKDSLFGTRSDDWTQLWPVSSTVAADTDPLDFAIQFESHEFLFATIYEKDLILFTDELIYKLTTNDNPLTITNIQIVKGPKAKISRNVRPTVMGAAIYFIAENGNDSSVLYSYYGGNEIFEESMLVAGYIPEGGTRLTPVEAFSSLMFWGEFNYPSGSSSSADVFMNSRYARGGELIQSAFHTWRTPPTASIKAIQVNHSLIWYIAFQDWGETQLVSQPFKSDRRKLTNGTGIFLDGMVDGTWTDGYMNTSTNLSTLSVDIFNTLVSFTVFLRQDNGEELVPVPTSDYGTPGLRWYETSGTQSDILLVSKDGSTIDENDIPIVYGFNYDSYITMPKIYDRDSTGKGLTTAKLQLRYLTVEFPSTTSVDVELTSQGGQVRTRQIRSLLKGAVPYTDPTTFAESWPPVTEDRLERMAVFGDSKLTTINFKAGGPFDFGVSSVTYTMMKYNKV